MEKYLVIIEHTYSDWKRPENSSDIIGSFKTLKDALTVGLITEFKQNSKWYSEFSLDNPEYFVQYKKAIVTILQLDLKDVDFESVENIQVLPGQHINLRVDKMYSSSREKALCQHHASSDTWCGEKTGYRLKIEKLPEYDSVPEDFSLDSFINQSFERVKWDYDNFNDTDYNYEKYTADIFLNFINISIFM